MGRLDLVRHDMGRGGFRDLPPNTRRGTTTGEDQTVPIPEVEVLPVAPAQSNFVDWTCPALTGGWFLGLMVSDVSSLLPCYGGGESQLASTGSPECDGRARLENPRVILRWIPKFSAAFGEAV